LIVQIPNRKFEDHVLARGLPATNVSNVHMSEARLPTIVPDDAAIGRMGAEYLLSLGFRALGFCWSGDSLYGRLRLDAFRKTAQDAGIDVHECVATRQDLGKWLTQL